MGAEERERRKEGWIPKWLQEAKRPFQTMTATLCCYLRGQHIYFVFEQLHWFGRAVYSRTIQQLPFNFVPGAILKISICIISFHAHYKIMCLVELKCPFYRWTERAGLFFSGYIAVSAGFRTVNSWMPTSRRMTPHAV